MSTQDSLQPALLLDQARQMTGGLTDFGDPSFRPGLEQLCHALNTEARLSPQGLATFDQKLTAQLANRLWMEDAIRRHPEILDEVIAPPLIIVGLPRTGTTKLHRLLSRDPRFYWMTFWESQMPVPLPGEAIDDPSPRIDQGQAIVDMMTSAMPELMAIHPMENREADEEFMLMEHSFLADFNAYAHIPSYMDWLVAQDERPAYSLLIRMLQYLQWQKRQRGITAQRWILKAPHHLHRMALLLESFPGACVVQTHRDPVESIPSIASFVHTLHAIYSDRPDAKAVGASWSARMRSGLEHTMAARDRAGDSHQFVDVSFKDTVTQPLQVLENLYATIGWDIDDATTEAMTQWLRADAEHHAQSAHRYSAEDFGLSAEGLRHDFAAYIARHLHTPRAA
ncbi:sulfotransferase family protein [Algiphilus sp.]|uniref:sulfotransferase family protein n=1 Tax=Algiphilus sp. TaxID=1872431 RepID=UPI003B519C7A